MNRRQAEGCVESPQALQLDLLYNAMSAASHRVAESIFDAAKGVGIVIVEGPFVMIDPKLAPLSTCFFFSFDPADE